MRVEGISVGDVIEVERHGRRFYALVAGPGPGGGFAIRPIDRGFGSNLCRPREVVGHWSRQLEPRRTSEPLRPSPRQLELELRS